MLDLRSTLRRSVTKEDPHDLRADLKKRRGEAGASVAAPAEAERSDAAVPTLLISVGSGGRAVTASDVAGQKRKSTENGSTAASQNGDGVLSLSSAAAAARRENAASAFASTLVADPVVAPAKPTFSVLKSASGGGGGVTITANSLLGLSSKKATAVTVVSATPAPPVAATAAPVPAPAVAPAAVAPTATPNNKINLNRNKSVIAAAQEAASSSSAIHAAALVDVHARERLQKAKDALRVSREENAKLKLELEEAKSLLAASQAKHQQDLDLLARMQEALTYADEDRELQTKRADDLNLQLENLQKEFRDSRRDWERELKEQTVLCKNLNHELFEAHTERRKLEKYLKERALGPPGGGEGRRDWDDRSRR